MKQSKINQIRQIVAQANIENKTVETRTAENYKTAVDLVIFEGEMLWQIMSAFLVVNTILVGFIAQIAFKDEKSGPGHFSSPCFFASLIGLALIFPWYGSFIRNSAYYTFRIAQAKVFEDKHASILRGNGENFAGGHQVEVDGKSYRIEWPGRFMKNRRAGYWMIAIFLTVYLVLFIVYGPWWLFCRV